MRTKLLIPLTLQLVGGTKKRRCVGSGGDYGKISVSNCLSPVRSGRPIVPDRALAQLAVFAAAAVIASERSGFAVLGGLASDAQSDAGHGLPSCFGNGGDAAQTMRCRRPRQQSLLRPEDSVLHGRVDLILYRAVAGPPCRHVFSPHHTALPTEDNFRPAVTSQSDAP
jgi:hypothetical protein